MKKLLLVLIISFPLTSYSQLLELYTGGVEAKNKELQFSYLIGGNLYLDLFQTQRQGKQQRNYANRVLLGFEHSALISKNVEIIVPATEISSPVEDCNCIEESIGTSQSEYSFTYKHKVRSVSLNIGIEIYKGWFLLSGLTDYQHILTLDNKEYYRGRNMYIDAGLQKVIKYNRWYFIPKVKFNHETTTFAVGVSYK